MKAILVSLLVGSSLFCQSEILWIVGNNYVGHWDYKNPAQFLKVNPSSWGLDKKSCDLWITQESQRNLDTISISPLSLKMTQRSAVNRLLTEEFENSFFVRSLDGKLEQHSTIGQVLATGPTIPQTSHRILATDQRLFLADFDLDSNRLSLNQFSLDLKAAGVENVFGHGELWTAPKMAWDPKSKNLWLGYSAQTASHIYSPIVELRDDTGSLKKSHIWPDKGLFFDLCLEEDGSILAIHDLPSPQFTVPVYSFIEQLTESLEPKSVYDVETNYFVDSIQCQKDKLVMLQRSIFGSDGSHIQVWNRGETGIGEKVLRLPERAEKIYSCRI